LPFEDEDGALRDIADAIDMIERFTSDLDLEQFSEDPKTVAAVERKLQIISEGDPARSGGRIALSRRALAGHTRYRKLAPAPIRPNRVAGHLEDRAGGSAEAENRRPRRP